MQTNQTTYTIRYSWIEDAYIVKHERAHLSLRVGSFKSLDDAKREFPNNIILTMHPSDRYAALVEEGLR